MAGLLDQARQGGMNAEGDPVDSATPPQAGDRGGEAPAGDADVSDDGEPNVTPEEQAQYEEFVKNGLRVIYGDEGGARPDILNRLREHEDDAIGTLANVTVWLVTMVESSAEQGGVEISDDVVMHGGIALLEELAEVSEAAKIHTYDQKEVNAALLQAMDLYREAGTASGKINPDDLKAQFDQIVAADKEGNVQSVLPQIQSGAPGEEAPPEEQV